MRANADVLTYNEITDNPADTLAVARSFSENSPAQVCGLRQLLENNYGSLRTQSPAMCPPRDEGERA